MTTIAENIQRIRERMADAAVRYGRTPTDITLVAVTKTVDTARIQEAAHVGVTDFGENYIQEARAKIANITFSDEHTDISPKWHLIGHLQTNKVKYSVELFSLIHSVDNYQLVQEINRQAEKRGKIQEILIEVNLTEQQERAGITSEELPRFVELCDAASHIVLRGLMGIAPAATGNEEARPHFARLYHLWQQLPPPNRQILSMGMSGDFEAAIAEGTTHVRIGSAIFGARPKPNDGNPAGILSP